MDCLEERKKERNLLQTYKEWNSFTFHFVRFYIYILDKCFLIRLQKKREGYYFGLGFEVGQDWSKISQCLYPGFFFYVMFFN